MMTVMWSHSRSQQANVGQYTSHIAHGRPLGGIIHAHMTPYVLSGFGCL